MSAKTSGRLKSVSAPVEKTRVLQAMDGSPILAPLPSHTVAVVKLINETITPSIVENGISRVVLARPHLEEKHLPAGVTLTRQGAIGRAVRRRGSISNTVARWPESGMEALRFPSFCFIYAGEADIPIGDAIVHCPQNTVLIIPPGVPQTEGLGPHWCRAHPENAFSTLLWLSTLPSGAQLHRCFTRGAHHEFEPTTGFLDHRFISIAEQLIQELDEALPFSNLLATTHFLTLMYLLQRHGNEMMTRVLPENAGQSYNLDAPETVVQRARTYIDRNLTKDLSLESIARASYVSRATLALLFKQQLNQTVWGYVTERRLSHAKSLLLETNIYVRQIAERCGFTHQSHFYARFIEAEGMTPGAWRKLNQRQPESINAD